MSVHQGVDQHAVVVLELERVEDAELVEELPAQVLSTHMHEANVSTCIGRGRDTRAVCKTSCVHGLRARAHPRTMGIGQHAEMGHLCTRGREEADVSARVRLHCRHADAERQRAGFKAPVSARTDERAARMLQ